MTRTLNLRASIVTFLALAGCTQQFAQGPTLGEAQAAIPNIPADRARVFIYRPYNFVGSAGTPYVQIDHWVMGEAPLSGALYCDIAPGTHEIWSMNYLANRQHMAQRFTADAGNAAYFRVAPNFSTGFDFQPVPAATGAQETQSMHLVAAHCEGTPSPTTAGAPPALPAKGIDQAMARGAAAEQSGDLAGALATYVEILQKYATSDFGPVSPAIERAIDVALKIKPRPAIPPEATQHAEAAVAKIKSAKTREDLDVARLEYKNAVALAPWWADAWFNLAALDEHLDANSAAAADLAFYLRASPNAPDAASIQSKIDRLRKK
jgi:hypothetical protein